MNNAIKSRLVQTLLFVACSFVARAGLAQGERGDDAKDGWVPVKHLTFTDDDIEGGIMAPDGTRIESVQPVTHPSLIELREGFEAEIVKTMEDM